MVEPQPSKLKVRVRFPLPAPSSGGPLASGAGSGPVIPTVGRSTAHIAQSVEHFLGKEEATGSIPVVSTKIPEFEKVGSVAPVRVTRKRSGNVQSKI